MIRGLGTPNQKIWLCLRVGDCLKKIFEDLFFFVFGEHLRLCPWPWLQAFLSLASRGSVRGGVEDTRLEAKAKDTKKIRGQGQGQPFRGQNLSRPRTGMLEAKDQGPRTQPQVFSKKKVFKKVFQAISNLKA